MDCNTARLYLQMGGTDAAELLAHLGECTACNHLVQEAERLDAHLGRAMRAVEVPKGVKEQLMYRLAADQGDRQRRWMGYAVRGACAAAVLLAVAWGVASFFPTTKPVLAGDSIVADFNRLRPYQDESNWQLKMLGAKGSAPSFVNYAFLCGEPALAILPGTQDNKRPLRVPQFVFAARPDERGRERKAVVYAVPRKDLTVEEVESPDPAYPWQLQIEKDEENWGTVYLILHTGTNWEWLRQPRRRD